MFKKLNNCLLDFIDSSEASDYWYDSAILEASGILKQFSKYDWEMLLKQLDTKTLFWQKRLVECLGEIHSEYEFQVIIHLISTNNEDLFVTCIDALRCLNLSGLNSKQKKRLLEKINSILETTNSLTTKNALKDFIHKLINSEKL